MSLVAGMVQPYFLAKASLPLPDYLLANFPGNAGVSPAVAPQGVVGTSLPVDNLETGIEFEGHNFCPYSARTAATLAHRHGP